MKKNWKQAVIPFMMTLLLLVSVSACRREVVQPESIERGGILCANIAGANCVESWNGFDLVVYSDEGSTETLAIDGATGNIDAAGTVASEGSVFVHAIQATTWVTSAGGTATLLTVPDGDVYAILSVFIETTTNWVASGDDETYTIGDGNDADGFIAAAHTQLLAAFTEATGYQAGYYGIEAGSGGAYTLDDGGPFIYAPSGAAETIDIAWGATGDDLTAGATTAHVIYMVLTE